MIKDYKKVKKFVSEKMNAKVHVCSFNVGAASEYPHCFLNINRDKEKKGLLKNLLIMRKKN